MSLGGNVSLKLFGLHVCVIKNLPTERIHFYNIFLSFLVFWSTEALVELYIEKLSWQTTICNHSEN